MPFTGVSHKVGEHIDTDAIIPARFLVTTDFLHIMWLITLTFIKLIWWKFVCLFFAHHYVHCYE